VGLQEFVYQDALTYRRLTLELLMTFKHTMLAFSWSTNEGFDRVTFQLMNCKYDMTHSEWSGHFGFFNGYGHVRSANRCLKPSPLSYFHKMSIFENTHKGSHIESCVIRYLYYVIANTL
jgi:hypothetical protein